MLPVQHNDVSRSRASGMVMLDVDGGGAAGYAPPVSYTHLTLPTIYSV